MPSDASSENYKNQKCELDELKEKIMQLERRNIELEKKLSSAAAAAVSSTSLDNSSSLINNNNELESSLNKTSEFKSINNCSLGNLSTNGSPIRTNIINDNNLTCSPITTKQMGTSLIQTIQPTTIPNINQGGFIITSNGSIAYVPPNNQNQNQSSPLKMNNNNSNLQIESSNNNNNSNYNLSSLFNEQNKIDLSDSVIAATSTSQTTDLNSFLSSKNFIYNNSIQLTNINQQQQQTVIKNDNNSKKKPKKISKKEEKQQSINNNKDSTTIQQQLQNNNLMPTAFILSANGQLVPFNPPTTTAPNVSSSLIFKFY
jgi:hypothetical protein